VFVGSENVSISLGLFGSERTVNGSGVATDASVVTTDEITPSSTATTLNVRVRA
jgi:hypothetical protein